MLNFTWKYVTCWKEVLTDTNRRRYKPVNVRFSEHLMSENNVSKAKIASLNFSFNKHSWMSKKSITDSEKTLHKIFRLTDVE